MAQPASRPRLQTAEEKVHERPKPGAPSVHVPHPLKRSLSEHNLSGVPQSSIPTTGASANAIARQKSLGGEALAQSVRGLSDSIAKIHAAQANRSRLKDSNDEHLNQVTKLKDWDRFPAVREAFNQSRKEREEELARIDADLKIQHDVRNSKEKDLASIFNTYSEWPGIESQVQQAINNALQAKEMSEKSKTELSQLRIDLRTVFTDNAEATARLSAVEAALNEVTATGKEAVATRQDLEKLNSLVQTLNDQREAQIKSDRDRTMRVSEAQVATVGSALKTVDQRLQALEEQQAIHIQNDKRQTERLDAFSALLSQQAARVDKALETHGAEATKMKKALQEMQEFNALKSDIEMGTIDEVKKELESQKLQLENMQIGLQQLRNISQKAVETSQTTGNQIQPAEDVAVARFSPQQYAVMENLTTAVEHTGKRVTTIEIALHSLETRWNNVTTEPIVRQVITAFHELYPHINDMMAKVEHFSQMAMQSVQLNHRLAASVDDGTSKHKRMTDKISELETAYATELQKLTEKVSSIVQIPQSTPPDISKLEGDVAELGCIVSNNDQQVAELRMKFTEFEKKERYKDFSLETLGNERERQAGELESLSAKIDMLQSQSREGSTSQVDDLEARWKQKATEDGKEQEKLRKQLDYIQTQHQSIISRFKTATNHFLEFKNSTSNDHKSILEKIGALEKSAKEDHARTTARLAELEQAKEDVLQHLKASERDASVGSLASSPTRQIKQEMSIGPVPRQGNSSTLDDLDPNSRVSRTPSNPQGKRKRDDNRSPRSDANLHPGPNLIQSPNLNVLLHTPGSRVESYQASPLSSRSSDDPPITFTERRSNKRHKRNKKKNRRNEGSMNSSGGSNRGSNHSSSINGSAK